MVSDSKLKNEIEKIVRREVRSGDILNVSFDRDRDSDGDEIIVVHVVFDAKQLNARETTGVTRYVRRRLSELGEHSFPLFYYISKSEAGKLAATS